MKSVGWIVVLGAVGILVAVGLAITYKAGGFATKRNTRYFVFPLAVIFPAVVAFWSAQDLIENFFPDLTLIDLGAFYAIGLISGLSAGLSLGLPRR